MSALGQKQTYVPQQAMSALPPISTVKADIRKRSCLLYPQKRTCAVHQVIVCFGPKADIGEPHSITSSARAMSDRGISRPSALAVWRLMVKLNLVERSIGRSAALAPLSILSTKAAARYSVSEKLTP